MILVLAVVTAFLAAVVQRITGLGFVLVLIGPAVLAYGPVEGVTVAVLLSLAAALSALPLVRREVDAHRAWRLIRPGLLALPVGALIVRILPDTALLLLVAAMAFFALLAKHLPGLSPVLARRSGAITAGAAAGFMHVTSGLSGPPLAAHAVGADWPQRSFAATVQLIFAVFSLVSVGLRGLPTLPLTDVGALVLATVAGIVAGSALARSVPVGIARTAMLAIAWAGAVVVLARGVLALVGLA